MRKTHLPFPALALALLHFAPVFGQVELRLSLLPGAATYLVTARPQVTWLPPLDDLTHSAQVTLVVPSGSFSLENLQSHAGNWALTHLVERPSENPGADYAVFELLEETQAIPWQQGQEIPLFSFQNSGDCLGAFELLQNDDVYSAPNPMNMPLGNSFVVEGAGGEAYYGNYDTGSANCLTAFNCLIFSQLKILPDGFYELSLETPGGMDSVASLQLALKVPTGLFQLHDLGNLQSGLLAFGATARYNAPPEAPGFDYFVFRLDAVSASGFTLAAGATPILRFANGGSCQGDSIFLLDNAHESFLPPNTQIADIAQKIRLLGGATFGLCAGEADAAPCSGCQFTPEVLHLDSVLAMPAAACLGYQNGMLKIFAQGANALEFSLDGGQIWSGNPVFTSLAAGIYQPIVRGTHFGCPVFAEGDPIEVAAGTEMNVLLDLPPKACAGDDIPLHILAPAQFPAGTAFSWTGPGGFASTIYDPVIFDVNNFQSGIYAVDVKVPGCETASDFATLQVAELPAEPVVLTNSPLCDGDTLRLQTAALPIAPTGVGGTQFEWISPAGISAWSSPDSLAFFPKNHPAYLSGEWRLRLSDANGCQAESAPVAVSIKNRPQAFAENTGPVCSGAAVQLLGNPMPGASYQWRKPGESVIFSMQPDPVVPNLTSLQTYSLTVSQDGCASENLSLTTVSLHPKTTILPESDYTVAADCSPEGLEFSANATGVGLNFKWTGVNGFLSHLENPEIADAGASQNGSYLLEATNLFGCVVSQPLLVSGVVDALPMPLVQGSPPVCPGETMQLETQAYDNFSVSYQWYKNNIAVGGGSASQLFLPNVQPANEGAYRVKVTVDDCVLNSANYNLDLLDLPAATPDFFLSNPCEGGVLQFFSNMDGIAAWHWTGPDGFVSEAPNPLIYNVEFDNVGAYALYVTGSNGCTAAANVVVDGILEVPEMPAVISNSPVCAEDQIVLTVQNPPIDGTVFFEWFNADGVLIAGGIGTAESTLVLGTADSLAKPPFVVKTVRNGCPSMLSDPVPVEVKPMPVAVAGYTEPVCPGSPVQLFAAPVPGGNYEWRAGGQAVAFGQNPTLILSDTTTYELVVKIEDCDAEASTTTTVPTLPTPQIAAVSGNGSYCEGTTLTLNAENSTPLDGQVQYVWTGPGGFSYAGSDEPDGDFSLTLNLLDEPNEGTYTLTLTSETGCVSTPQSAAINVAAMPLPPTLTAAENTLCQGETLQLDVTPVAGSNVDYQWYFHDGSNDTLLGSTSFPTYFLPSVTASNSGTYFAIVEVEGCGSTPSNLVPVEVTGATTNLLATNSTLAQAACSGGQVDLFVPFVPGANYVWYGPAGFSSELPNPLIVNAQANQSGSYLVVVELPGCLTTLTSSTEVLIGETPALPVLAGEPAACEGEDVTLHIANAQPGVTYDFFSGQNLLALGVAESLILENVVPAMTGNYAARGSANGCFSAVSEIFHLTVDALPGDVAAAGGDQMLCPDAQEALLFATLPSIGSGYWISLDEASLANPGLAETAATNLRTGENRFVWTLSNGACEGYSTDTMSVFRSAIPEATGEELALPADSNLLDVNLLENDVLENSGDWTFSIFKNPSKGFLESDGDGMVSYQPYPHAFGFDDFTYRLCLTDCPDACDTALVTLKIEEETGDASTCFVPNLVTPNSDGENETLVIPCTMAYPGSALTVFNRWGAKVFQSVDYQNDWGGDYDGLPLPVGTYFYQLSLNDEPGTVLHGYVVVMR